MKVEYLLDGSSDCPLIRLSDFNTAEACQLRGICNSLAVGQMQEVVLTDLANVTVINDCRLALCLHPQNQGIVQTSQDTNFECLLSREGWATVVKNIEPFCQQAEAGRFQWLNETSRISLLLSPDGFW